MAKHAFLITLSLSPSLPLSLSLSIHTPACTTAPSSLSLFPPPLGSFLTFPCSISDNLSIKRLPRRTAPIFLDVASLRLRTRAAVIACEWGEAAASVTECISLEQVQNRLRESGRSGGCLKAVCLARCEQVSSILSRVACEMAGH